MAYRYVLSAVVEGHSNDVRCVCPFNGKTSDGSKEGIISGSRDCSARLWMPKDSGEHGNGGSLNQWSPCTIFKGHTNYVSCVAFRDPDEKFPEGLIYTGCNDGKIRAYTPFSSDPFGVLDGHTATVAKIFVSSKKTLLSASWDATARVWVDDSSVMVLKGHSAAVWCAAIIPQIDVMVTGSADKTIKLWKTGSCKKTLSRHTQAVRDLGILGSNQFLSCGNDGNIFVWQVVEDTLEANVIYNFNCQDFVYSLCIVPSLETSNSLATDWVSSGENGAVKVFREGRVEQEIVIPALSVWSVTIIENGDLVAACSDNRIYVFTQDKGRMAPPDMLALFDAEVEKHKGSSGTSTAPGSELPEEIGGVKTADMPGPEALNYPGKRDGQTKMIRDGNLVTVYSWSAGKETWERIGDVVGQPDKTGETPAPGSKVMFEGQEYDHVFNVDVDEGVVLKLPYNDSEEPYVAAQRFIHRHNLPQDYLDQVASFITKNSSGGPAISQGYSGDPLTGGSAYVSGSGGVKASSFTSKTSGKSSDPFTGAGAYSTMDVDVGTGDLVSQFFPQTTFLNFSQIPKLDALTKKLLEFNESMPPHARLEEDQLTHLVKLPETEKVMAADVPLLLRVLQWPKESAFNPMLDVVRLAILNDKVAAAILDHESFAAEFADVIISHVADKAKSTNQMLAVKVLANMFSRPSGLKLLMGLREVVLQQTSVLLPTDNKSTQASIATLILNYSVACKLDASDSGIGSSEAQKQSLTLTSLLLDSLNDPESQFRALVAVGTLIHSSPANVAFSKTLDMKEKVKNLRLISETAKIKEICNELTRCLN